jgi:hypothetical protein
MVLKERVAVLNIAGGCWATKQYRLVPIYSQERLFGNCRSLQSAKLEKANLSGANLSGADLRDANLSGAGLSGANFRKVQLGCHSFTDLDGEYIGECSNLKDIKWNEDTQWQGITGWEQVENIPSALKQQLRVR